MDALTSVVENETLTHLKVTLLIVHGLARSERSGALLGRDPARNQKTNEFTKRGFRFTKTPDGVVQGSNFPIGSFVVMEVVGGSGFGLTLGASSCERGPWSYRSC